MRRVSFSGGRPTQPRALQEEAAQPRQGAPRPLPGVPSTHHAERCAQRHRPEMQRRGIVRAGPFPPRSSPPPPPTVAPTRRPTVLTLFALERVHAPPPPRASTRSRSRLLTVVNECDLSPSPCQGIDQIAQSAGSAVGKTLKWMKVADGLYLEQQAPCPPPPPPVVLIGHAASFPPY